MANFIAIPVSRGDAFYLERVGLTVLVDGGQNQLEFPALFQRYTRRDRVDVIICTHNDADHANGIIGFLQAGLQCNEVWLPGRWLSALPYVLMPPKDLINELKDNVAQSPIQSYEEMFESDLSPIEAFAQRFSPESFDEPPSTNEELKIQENGWSESCVRMLEQTPLISLLPSEDTILFRSAKVGLLWSALHAATRIRNIATLAFHSRIRVRWFEYTTGTPLGGSQWLRPVNAREVISMHPCRMPLLEYLALTVSNRESLVFWSPPATGQHPGVLFTADSDLEGVCIPSRLRNALVTAPHHGSERNANAYTLVGGATGRDYSSIRWVRSDGRFADNPGNSYRRLSPCKRLCTHCQLAPGVWSRKRVVRLVARGNMWTPWAAPRYCSCFSSINV